MTAVDRTTDTQGLLVLATLGAGIAVWWLATALLAIPPFVFPSPTAVGSRLLGDPVLYVTHATFTLQKIVVGGCLGIGSGFCLAIVIAHVPLLRRALYPYLVAVRVLPKVAIAPLLLIYLGVGFGTAVLFIALITFFPMVVSTAAGFDRVPEKQDALMRSVDAPPLRTFREVRFPYTLPDVFAGLKQAVTLSVIGAVVAEWIVADEGLGYLILVASENVRPDVMLAALSILVALGFLLYGSVVLLQRRLDWTRYASHRRL